MKNRLFQVGLCVLTGASSLLQTSTSLADEPTGASVQIASTPIARMPYGVEDIVKLSRAKVSEEIILTYVQTSGTIYNLGPNDIVYLRDQGVTDRVVNTMLDQRKKPSESVSNTQQQPVYANNGTTATAPTYNSQPAPIYVQPAASTVHVIPYRSSSYLYNGYPGSYWSPYYGGYRSYGGYASYGCYAPSLSLSFGFGGRGYWGGSGYRCR